MTIDKLIVQARNYYAKRNYREAEQIIHQALKLDAKNDDALQLLALILLNTRRYSQAYETLISMSANRKNSSYAYWYNLGLIQGHLDNNKAAIAAYKRSLELSPKFTKAYTKLLPLLEKNDFSAAVEYLFKAIRHLGLTTEYTEKLRSYRQSISKMDGLHAPIAIKISKNKGTIKIKSTPLESLAKLKGLGLTRFILTELSIQHCNLSKITHLEHLSELVHLNLLGNAIQKIEGLDDLQQLNRLSLGYNKIQKIEGLEQLTKLRSLFLDGNAITRLEGLESLTNLHSLSAKSNKIATIEGLEHLQKLNLLDLDGNAITKISGLEKLANLITLSLNNNRIERIEGLDTLTKLQYLHLRNNNIQSIGGLTKMSNLSIISLSDNKITSMDGLEEAPNLAYIYLENNQLKTIDHISTFRRLKKLDLTGNNDLPTQIRKKFSINHFVKRDLKEYCGLTKDELEKKIVAVAQEKEQSQKRIQKAIQKQTELKQLPDAVRSAYQALLKKEQPGRCLYCGHPLPEGKNWVHYCKQQIGVIIQKANAKFPKQLFAKFDVEIDTYQADTWDKSSPAHWEQTGKKTFLNLKKFERVKRLPTKFSHINVVAPKGTLCKGCADTFLAQVAKVFSAAKGTKFPKKHAEMFEGILNNYYKVFKALVDNAP